MNRTFSHHTSSSNEIERIILLGGGGLLHIAINELQSYNIDIRVVTSPRHLKLVYEGKSLEEFLLERKIVYRTFSKLEKLSLQEFCGKFEKSIALSISSPWIFKDELIKGYFKNKLINIHGAGLPNDRGGGGFSWRILMNNRFGYVTAHLVEKGVDTGPIVFQEEFIFPDHCRIPIDYERVFLEKVPLFLSKLFSELILEKKQLESTSQLEFLSTYWPRLNTDVNSWIDWNMYPEQLERFICAFDKPYGGSMTCINSLQVRIRNVITTSTGNGSHPFQSGLVVRKAKDFLVVALQGSNLIIREVLDIGGDNILKAINVGDRFYSPLQELDKAKSTRVYYNSMGVENKSR